MAIDIRHRADIGMDVIRCVNCDREYNIEKGKNFEVEGDKGEYPEEGMHEANFTCPHCSYTELVALHDGEIISVIVVQR